MHIRTLSAALIAGALLAGPAAADTLVMDKVSSDRSAQADRPARGMRMARVENAFGTPVERIAAVGEPPITRWVYANYVVFFEHDRVLHTVTKHATR